MANSIAKTATLLKRTLLSNLGAKDGEALTPVISGPHGIGKSQIVKTTAKAINGYPIIVEASTLSEGELTGLPFQFKLSDGSNEVRYTPHWATKAIMRLQKDIYERAQEGLLNKTLKLNSKGETERLVDGKWVVIDDGKNRTESILSGEENMYEFGENLDFDTKMALIESGDIRPIVLFIDELNRTDNQVMKELMNIILNKTIQGYHLPWWCFICSAINPASQNSQYATNEMDGAQLDRFIKFVATCNPEEWIDHGLNTSINKDLLEALSVNPQILTFKDDTTTDQTGMRPSPRSWSMIASFMDHMFAVNNTKFFTKEEQAELDDDFHEILVAKVGSDAARTFKKALSSKQDNVKPDEIFTGASGEIADTVMRKLKNQKTLQSKVTSDNVLQWLCDNFDKFAEKKSAKEVKEKAKYTNFGKQLKEYFVSLEPSVQRLALTKSLKVTTKKGKMLYLCLSEFDIFNDAIYGELVQYSQNVKKVNDEN